MDTEGGILGALFAGCLLATVLLSTLVLAAPPIVAHPIFLNALSVIAAEEAVKATAVVSTKLLFAVITALIIREGIISISAPYRVCLDALLVLADKPFKRHRPGRPNNLIN